MPCINTIFEKNSRVYLPDGVVYSDEYCVEKCFQNKLILRVLLQVLIR